MEKKSRTSKNDKSNSKTTKEEDEETVQVEFVARKCETMDFNGIEKLLEQLFLRCTINLSDIADLLIKNNHVGSVIKIDNPVSDEDDSDIEEDLLADKRLQQELEDNTQVYGICSVVDLNSKETCVEELVTFVKKMAKLDKLGTEINNLLASNNVGMIISERFVNIPHLIALPCYRSLISEMDQVKDGYDFDFYLIPSKNYKLNDDDEDSVFVQQEDIVIQKNAVHEIRYCVKEMKDNAIVWDGEEENSDLIPYRSIFVLTKTGLNKCIEMLENEEMEK